MQRYNHYHQLLRRAALVLLVLLLALGVVIWQRERTPHTATSAQERTLGLHSVADIPLPDGISRFDYQSLDQIRGQLYIAHLGASHVTVVDIHTQKVIADIPNVSQVHGILAVPQLGRVYASATGDNQVVTIDEQSLGIIATTQGGGYPDGIAYDPDDHKLFVSDQFGKTVTVLDANTNQRIDTIAMDGEVGNTQYDPTSHRIYSAVQTRNQLVVINPTTDQVSGRYAVPGCDHPHGLYIDAVAHVAFIACEDNATLVTFDLDTMQVGATFPVGAAPDVLAFDPDLHRLYVAAESGVLAIFTTQGKTIHPLAQGFLAERAHTIAVDPHTHYLYLPLENVNGQPVLRIMEPL